jgi:hypothetical protein
LSDRSALRRFVTAWRDFGFDTAMRVAYSKVRGGLCPALALPDPPVYSRHRDVSVLLSTSEQDAATLHAVVGVLAGRSGLDWEVCICECSPVEAEMARALARWRGTKPWIRIVTAGQSVDAEMAARWTVEQATGEFVALVAPGYTPKAGTIAKLVVRLRNDSAIEAAALAETGNDADEPKGRDDCRLLLQRKKAYLAGRSGHWPLTARALARDLDKAGVPTAYLPASEIDATGYERR